MYAMSVVLNVPNIRMSIARSVRRSVTVVRRNADEWQVSLHKINAGKMPAFYFKTKKNDRFFSQTAFQFFSENNSQLSHSKIFFDFSVF
jgi:hypothetical protein